MLNRMRRIGHWLLIGTLFVSLGGHLTLLQTFAWGSMFVGFSRTASLQESASKTFDGDHPCSLCKVVNDTKKQDQKKSLVKAESKMEVIIPSRVVLKNPLGTSVKLIVPAYFGFPVECCFGVPLRPPRVA